MSIADNLKVINENIRIAAEKSNRKMSDITLIGVTKTIDTARISELIGLGVNNLGENRVQEFLTKYNEFGPKPDWHMIGHLQTNKVKGIIGKTKLIHSVDSAKLAAEIDKYSQQSNIVTDILIEINIGGEPNKHGIRPEQAIELIGTVSELQNVKVRGLMTVAPIVEKPEDCRIYFTKMKQIYVDINAYFNNNIDMRFLSMGMTNDYTVAIEEGANMVRIGTGIFAE